MQLTTLWEWVCSGTLSRGEASKYDGAEYLRKFRSIATYDLWEA
ncbi:hypothetical protein [Cryomorpha ignava]|nr:hypothetical protein [Cryomorpha ignava]